MQWYKSIKEVAVEEYNEFALPIEHSSIERCNNWVFKFKDKYLNLYSLILRPYECTFIEGKKLYVVCKDTYSEYGVTDKFIRLLVKIRLDGVKTYIRSVENFKSFLR